MTIYNDTKERTFGLPGLGNLLPGEAKEVPDALSETPAVKLLLKRGALVVVEEKAAENAELEALLKKIKGMRRDGLVKLCAEYGLPVVDEEDAKALKEKLTQHLVQGGDGNGKDNGEKKEDAGGGD